MSFYTNCLCIQNKIYLREIVDGERIQRQLNYKPTLFLPVAEDSKYKTLDGKNVEAVQFASIKEARNFVSEYKDIENFELYGNTNYQYTFIGDEYPKNIEYDFSKLVVCNFDIEVASENGFPTPELAQEEVTSITMKVMDKFLVFGCKAYKNSNPDVKYFHCSDEKHLLSKFLQIWEQVSPDIITGWFCEAFDVPYLVNRITKLLGTKEVRKLSPWGWVKEKKSFYQGKESIIYNLVGISCLDYLTIYKNKSLNPSGASKENHKLNTIAHLELGEKKLSVGSYDATKMLITSDHVKVPKDKKTLNEFEKWCRIKDKLKEEKNKRMK